MVRTFIPISLAFCCLAAVCVSLFLTGCGPQRVKSPYRGKQFISEEAAREQYRQQGLDALGSADLRKIDELIADGEYNSAKAMLAALPPVQRDLPPAHYRAAYLAVLDSDIIHATKELEKARVGKKYPIPVAEMAIFLDLYNGQPTKAGVMAAEVLMNSPRRGIVWQYFIDALRRAPVSVALQSATNALVAKFPRLPETKALQAQIVFSQGQPDTGLKWMRELASQHPNNRMIQRAYLDMLRNMGNWRKAATVAENLAKKLAPDSPLRGFLVEELESLRRANLQAKSDPLKPSVDLRDWKGDLADLQARMPAGVPLNNNDPSDDMPPDLLDENAEPLYFLPYRAGEIFYLGVRPDKEPTAMAPAMEDPEEEYRPRYSYCFLMPEGTPVMAARGGVVKRVSLYLSDGENEYQTVVEIAHRDGTTARYWHLERFRVAVQPGETVYRGQIIGGSGKTALSRHQHLRFEVVAEAPKVPWYKPKKAKWWDPYIKHKTIPIRFADVAEQNGAPLEGRWYRSRNVWVPNAY